MELSALTLLRETRKRVEPGLSRRAIGRANFQPHLQAHSERSNIVYAVDFIHAYYIRDEKCAICIVSTTNARNSIGHIRDMLWHRYQRQLRTSVSSDSRCSNAGRVGLHTFQHYLAASSVRNWRKPNCCGDILPRRLSFKFHFFTLKSTS